MLLKYKSCANALYMQLIIKKVDCGKVMNTLAKIYSQNLAIIWL